MAFPNLHAQSSHLQIRFLTLTLSCVIYWFHLSSCCDNALESHGGKCFRDSHYDSVIVTHLDTCRCVSSMVDVYRQLP